MSKTSIIAVHKGMANYYDYLLEAFERFGLTSNLRQVHFFAQAAHESASYGKIAEGGSYSAEGLRKTFPAYFSPAEAQQYARRPEAILSRAYANRLGNGNEASGDGWRYRGGGLIQVTGKSQYASYSKQLFGDDRLIRNPELIRDSRSAESRRLAAMISAAWWKNNDINRDADRDDVLWVSKRINQGPATKSKKLPNGYADRVAKTNNYKNAMGLETLVNNSTGVVDNKEMNPIISEGKPASDPNAPPKINNPNNSYDIAPGSPPVGSASDFAPPGAELSRPSSCYISPWPNRTPNHEPWPRVLLLDGTTNKPSENYVQNVNQFPQFEDDGTEAHSGKIGRVEGEETIERGEFWRR